ncbi:hypothetical protein [uncultured Demequina sp.]|uniref:hypothetical protein n=1 Tax=uncultured Demequina sp. TaxID=693499 RepID=UPI0025E6130C|nr:hypothetical protein [uncultured Demequina sp.]
MARDVDRRTLLRGSLTVAAAGVLASCRPEADPTPVTTPSPERTPAPAHTEEASRSATSERPTLASSYGPNGTHYPDALTWPGEVAPTELTADCDWAEIADILASLTAEQVAAGVVIRLRPGSLPGEGAKSSSTPVLGAAGDAAWERNVLICPLDGFGSVTFTDGIRLDHCARLSFFGFSSEASFVLTECQSMQVGWSRFSGMNVTRSGVDIEFHELVLGFRRDPEDTAGVRPTETFEMSSIVRRGCVFGPSVKANDSDAHCDTIQMEGTGTGPFGPFVSVDCVDFGSSNAAELLSGGLQRAEYTHCLILAGLLPWTVYPLEAGDYQGEPNAFSGGCPDVRLVDCTVVGAVGRMGFTEVRGSTLSYYPQDSQQPRVTGAWEVDESTARWTREDIMARQALPDYSDETLRGLWVW